MKQIDSQSDLILRSNFVGPSFLAISSSVYIISIWDPCISNLYNLCQTGSNYIRPKVYQCVLHFNRRITRTHFLRLQPSIRPVPAQVSLLWKGPPRLCIKCYLVPCERSRQNHLVIHIRAVKVHWAHQNCEGRAVLLCWRVFSRHINENNHPSRWNWKFTWFQWKTYAI